jgi:uroporphyrinogen-III decarboxylase
MSSARRIAGSNATLCGNVDPLDLFGSEDTIRASVNKCVLQSQESLWNGGTFPSGGEVKNIVLNLGHGVEKDTKESAVRAFVEAGKAFSR